MLQSPQLVAVCARKPMMENDKIHIQKERDSTKDKIEKICLYNTYIYIYTHTYIRIYIILKVVGLFSQRKQFCEDTP